MRLHWNRESKQRLLKVKNIDQKFCCRGANIAGKLEEIKQKISPKTALSTAVCPLRKPSPSCHHCPEHINDMNSKSNPEQQKACTTSSHWLTASLSCPCSCLCTPRNLQEQEEHRLERKGGKQCRWVWKAPTNIATSLRPLKKHLFKIIVDKLGDT